MSAALPDGPAAASPPQVTEDAEQVPAHPQEDAAHDMEVEEEQLGEGEELGISLGGPGNDDPGGDTSERNGEVALS
jgi:hypothetical protein